MGLLPFDKLARASKIIYANGGPLGAFIKLWRTDTLKVGRFMGSDTYGNKYYEDTYYMIGRSRWVEFNPKFKWEYDASQVTAEWYGWLHYKSDCVPCQNLAKVTLNCCCWAHCWLQPHQENRSGTELAYYPYSTVIPRIHIWDGCCVCPRNPCA